MVAATVHPKPGRKAVAPSLQPEALPAPAPKAADPPVPPPSPWTRTDREAFRVGMSARADPRPSLRLEATGKDIEPGRKHRIARERDPIGARIDLHGMDQDRAKAALESFLRRAWDDGLRAVLVITGKGVRGDGILRRRTPEWLASPGLRDVVAGISEAHRRHGGEGALYVALKRKARD
jgi:DNA-nicking Smr family endonuclease